MSEIRMNYQEMHAVASDVSAQAGQSREVIAALQRDVNRLLPTWVGLSQEAFQSTYAACQRELALLPQMLDQVSQALLQAANSIEQAEHQAQADIHTAITSDNA